MISRNTYQRKDGRWGSRVYTNCNKSTKKEVQIVLRQDQRSSRSKTSSYLQEL